MRSTIRGLVQGLLAGEVDLDNPMYAVLLDGVGAIVSDTCPIHFEARGDGDNFRMESTHGISFDIGFSVVIHSVGLYSTDTVDAQLLADMSLTNTIAAMAGDTVQFASGTLNVSISNSVGMLLLSDFYPGREPSRAGNEQIEISTVRKVRIGTHGKAQNQTAVETEVRTRRIRAVGRRQNPGGS